MLVVVWLLIVYSPDGPVVAARLPDRDSCFITAIAKFRDMSPKNNKPKGACIKSIGLSAAPV